MINYFECYAINVQGYEFLYTNSQKNETLLIDGVNKTFTAIPIKRGDLITSVDTEKGSTTMSMSKRSTLINVLRLGVPHGKIYVTVYTVNSSSEVKETFHYTASSYTLSGDDATFDIINESLIYSLKINSEKYSRTCRHNLYAQGCYVDRELYRQDVNLTRVSRAVFNAPALTDSDKFVGGYIEYSYYFEDLRHAFLYRRDILSVYDTQITLSDNDWLIDDLTLVACFRGCDKSEETCLNDFDNIGNYGGQSKIPVENPNTSTSF